MRFDKGKPGQSRGRKAMGLLPGFSGYDCQAAEPQETSGRDVICPVTGFVLKRFPSH
jgi:hypothetical protein